MKINQKTVFTFKPYFDGYFCEGKWFSADDFELKVRHYNGRNCINYSGKRYGINTLRKN